MESDERLVYLGPIPHAHRSILLLSAAMMLLHPKGAGIIQEVRGHHPDVDGHRLCIQVLLDVMISIGGKWNAGSAVLLPVASLVEQVVGRATGDPGALCPLALAEQMWELIERLHDQPDHPVELTVQPSSN